MKKFNIKTRVALSLLFAISMASASQRSWTNRANATWESGKEYAIPVYNYARNNPYKAGAIVAVGAGVLTAAYMARNRIKAGARKSYNWATKWDQKDQKQIADGINEHNRLSGMQYPSELEEQQVNLLKSGLKKQLQYYEDLQFPSTTELKTLRSLQEWRRNVLGNMTDRTAEQNREFNRLEKILQKR